ncbi:sorbosone dehydrogenase [Niastella koreensis]|uniref:L-sorbosone dehydrogenase n=2 Tax=Niastella koreensis TaxID=354356 RepID=G8TJK7_NIAKG|nr:PQQ-dependent sugar dehydrogenase [Niastella koreensis]AEW00754.1 L-sorbosone dehydrogenase [Niastella koreensis GR20-10]OQP42374.1 sorbosone dehydrogenase [Niastella koreensis]
MKKVLILACSVMFAAAAFANDTTRVKSPSTGIVKRDEAPITLPQGFKSVVVAADLGRARHLVVAANGDVFVKLSKLKDGKGIIRLHDKNGDGKADEVTGFGTYTGTGITIKNGYLYASSDEEIFRYKIDEKTGKVDEGSEQKIVTGLVSNHQHETKSIVLDNNGNLYTNIGAPSNCCQVQDRVKGSPGQDPCPILEKAGGIWQFKADKTNQSYPEGVRYATGLRNVMGLDWNTEVNELYVMQHGRDMLFQFFPELFNQKQGAENPAEEMFRITKGADCGWPYCYYDNDKQQKLLCPEYGGNREKVDRCADKTKSIVQFPGHLAPNALLFYTGKQFPEKYKNGAFIAFHGSWNRAPEPQAGFFVVFVPFKNGMPSGKWEVFADGFSQIPKDATNGRAKYRPCGLAQGPDGSLFVSDDSNGTIWKVSYGK